MLGMMDTLSRRRSTENYFLAWNLLQAVRDEEAEIRRNIHLRAVRRKMMNPINVNNKEFKKRYRLSKPAFKFLCEKLRAKTTLKSTQKITMEHKVLCALSFYATGSYQRLVGMAQYMGQSTISKYIQEVTLALNTPALINEFIRFPMTKEKRNINKQKFYTQFGIPGVIGCVDGSHFQILRPNKEIEHLFYCRKHFYSLNVQLVCDSDCRILTVNPKYGGATHDSFIWDNSRANAYMQTLHSSNEFPWVLGDSGYSQQPWLMTPVAEATEGTPEALYNKIHQQARVVIENTFEKLRNRWRCASKNHTLHYTPEKCAEIITACCMLHNLAIDFRVADPKEAPSNIKNHFIRNEVTNENNRRDDLIRGKAMRNQLVQRLSMLH